MNKKRFGLLAAAAALTLSVSVGTALAYFTTYVTASGGVELSLTPTTTTITEEFSDWTKHVTIKNDGEADCYVRVKAIAPEGYTLEYSGTGWTEGETDAYGCTYWYYDTIVPTGGEAEKLDIEIENVPEDATDFNVVVIQECTPVLYGEDGTALDWQACWSSAEGGD